MLLIPWTATKPVVRGDYGEPIPRLRFQMVHQTDARTHVKITDADDTTRWEVPGILRQQPWENNFVEDRQAVDVTERSSNNSLLSFNYFNHPFSFNISRSKNASGTDVIFGSSYAPMSLIFKDQYLRIGTLLAPENVVYGIGQHVRQHIDLQPGTYTLWNHDEGQSANMYGSHTLSTW